MEYYNFYVPFELTHHGIKGQKWGVRRFQNKDGSLTLAGGKRYNGSDYKPVKSIGQKISDLRAASKQKKALKKEEEAKAAAEKRKQDVESGNISAKNMTRDELNSRIERLRAEKQYKQLLEETNPSSKVLKEGQSVVSKFWNEAIKPAATEAGKQLLKDKLIKEGKKQLGLTDEVDEVYKALKKEADTLNLKQQISGYKKTIMDNERYLKGEKTESERIKQEATDAMNAYNKDRFEQQLKDAQAKRAGFESDNDKTARSKGYDSYDDYVSDTQAKATKEGKREQKKATEAKREAKKEVQWYNEQLNKKSQTGDDITDRYYYTSSGTSSGSVKYPPAVINTSVSKLSSMATGSKECNAKAEQGKKYIKPEYYTSAIPYSGTNTSKVKVTGTRTLSTNSKDYELLSAEGKRLAYVTPGYFQSNTKKQKYEWND